MERIDLEEVPSLHILVVTGRFPSITFIFRMVMGLAERGHRVTVAARNPGDWDLFQQWLPLPRSIEVVYLPPEVGLRDPVRFWRLVRSLPPILLNTAGGSIVDLWKIVTSQPSLKAHPIRQVIRYIPFLTLEQPDVIQFEFLVTGTQYPLLGDLLDVPTVVSCRGADLHMLEQRDEDRKFARLKALERATTIHCVAAELVEQVTRLTGRTERVMVNRPAVPFEEIPVKDDYSENGPPVIVSVGRLVWKKGYDYLLAALWRIKRAGVSFRAEIIGDGELWPKLRFSMEDLGLIDEVTLLGRIPPADVLLRLHKADLFVLASHEEGIANSVLEAMAAGLPVIVTNAGGMAEAVRDGVDGYVVPVRDIDALTGRIGHLLDNPNLREQMGQSARQRVIEMFNMERQITVFEQIYYETIRLEW